MSQIFYAVAGIFVITVVLAGILYWNENRDRRVGVASYVDGLLTTLMAGAVASAAIVAAYIGILLLFLITGTARQTIELAILILGSWIAGQHIHIQRQKARREREDVACLLQEQWTRSITKAILAEDPTRQDEAVREVRDLYRRCRIIMNDDAALLLSHILQVTNELSDASGGTSDDKAMAKDWLRRLIVPRIPMEPSAPVTTTVLELFRAYSRGGLSGWRSSRQLLRGTAPEGLLVNSGLVEGEEAILGAPDGE